MFKKIDRYLIDYIVRKEFLNIKKVEKDYKGKV